MMRNWSFGRRVGTGFMSLVLIALAIGAIAVNALRAVVARKDQVIAENAGVLIDIMKLNVATETKVASLRGFLLTRDGKFLDELGEAHGDFVRDISHLRTLITSDGDRRLVDQIEQAEAKHQAAVERVIALRKSGGTDEGVLHYFTDQVLPLKQELDRLLDKFDAQETGELGEAKHAATEFASSAISTVVSMAGLAVLLAVGMALLLTRSVTTKVQSAVQRVESSSVQLQSVANQQASASKESASSMSEITTTINELLVTSRQIVESARRVASIAGEATHSARTGEQLMQKAHESSASIKRQVDLIVTHMLDLGRKSQQIGGILEIINELSAQTNILAINATIEAAGAGESGRRFAVVADEIRKLADRVGGSTQEIRSLIEEIRASVNTTVMATESGAKAVDAGARQFGEVAGTFKQITSLVGTTTEAAKEIELSTQQQATAVEQVNLAVASVAQAAKETELSSSETLDTATQLTGLSRELMQLIQPSARA